MSEPDVLEISIYVEAAPETVFPYFTDPRRYRQWMGTDVELDPRPGGIYRVKMRECVETCGTFIDVDPPRRVEFTWGWSGDDVVPPGSSRVVVTLAAEDSGTRVLLRHHGLPTNEQRDHHGRGWDIYLQRLLAVLSGVDPGMDPNADAPASA